MTSEQPGMTTIEFVCRDTGIGMTEAFQKRIFEPFAQEHAGSRTKFAGTGLGMPITKKLVVKMGGTISFESKEGIGTTFLIRIPFRIDTDRKDRTEAEEKTESHLFSRKYYVGYIDRYSKKITDHRPSKAQVLKYTSLQRVASDCKKGGLKIRSISCKETSNKNYKFNVNITGLEKYMLKIDTVDFKADLLNVEDVFAEWDIIQKELVDMSQFYSLIDIYGHYANRGDTVRVKTELKYKTDSLLVRAINYFGDSYNCGIYLSREIVAQQLGISLDQIEMVILMMRELRFDIRTTNTHPTIRTDEIICTYPFPMLSERVMFDKCKGAISNG